MVNMSDMGILQVLGVRVRLTHDLDEGGLWLPDLNLLLVDVNTTTMDQVMMVDEILPEVESLQGWPPRR